MGTAPVILLLLGRGLPVSEAEQRQELDVSILQLDYPLEVDTPLGRGWAILVETDGLEQWWTIALNESRAFVTFKQRELRCTKNYSLGGVSHDEMKKIIQPKEKAPQGGAKFNYTVQAITPLEPDRVV